MKSIDKYKVLRSCLRSSNEQGILDSLWNNYPHDRARTYTKLVKESILEYVNLVARKIGSLMYGVSIRKEKT